MAFNDNRDIRIVMLPESRHWNHVPEGEACLLESIPGIVDSFFLKIPPGGGLVKTAPSIDREILVMEGSVEVGGRIWRSGGYLRLAGDHRIPSLVALKDGALVFVKMGHFPEDDRRSVGIDTEEGLWIPGLVDGLSVQTLFSGGTINTALVRWAPGTVFQPHRHFGGEEILVLSGVFEDEHGAYPAGSWYRAPHMSRHHPFSTLGCTIFVKTGHLSALSAA